MKKKIYSILSAGMLCACRLFSSLVPVQEASAHAGCEHLYPPRIVEEEDGYKHDSVYHWKQYTTVAKCRDCGLTLQIVSQRTDSKGPHVFDQNRYCIFCHYK